MWHCVWALGARLIDALGISEVCMGEGGGCTLCRKFVGHPQWFWNLVCTNAEFSQEGQRPFRMRYHRFRLREITRKTQAAMPATLAVVNLLWLFRQLFTRTQNSNVDAANKWTPVPNNRGSDCAKQRHLHVSLTSAWLLNLGGGGGGVGGGEIVVWVGHGAYREGKNPRMFF